ncbi:MULTISPECIES: DEAD/DEAH box helicase family protein [unclassified Pseudomonas]|uniref:DEAD/DEAH box helicase family protein n=1 Tax=unclassified Pseudomonas TaxID=196821 RepID=UPI0002702699|nr:MULTISPECIES: DEAD/DEAH box helicase family protein [unclassified Pseudomonas]EJM00833.1 DNA/RNA helicase, superfamily II [Pseudomonas sp. GM16]EJM45663.1 DNA/RNA helicase, superfamily II [Pseudomonas sp. GM24]
MFEELDLPLSINTSSEDPSATFFDPVLKRAVTYDVGVGYFTSGWIADTAQGISQFARSRGKGRWIVGHELQEKDLDCIVNSKTMADKEFQAKRIFEEEVDELLSVLKEDARLALAWLIRDGIVELKVAVPTNKLSGIYHAKNGIFSDGAGNDIAFSGSYNLTSRASSNWETIDIYRSWTSEEGRLRCEKKKHEFESTWQGRDPNLLIFTPTSTTLDKIKAYATTGSRPYSLPSGRPAVPQAIQNDEGKIRGYQEKAIKAWFAQNGQGLFCMATGAGKTITALTAATRLLDYFRTQQAKLVIVITVPYLHLGEQWADEAAFFGYDAIKCYGGKDKWLGTLQSAYNQLLSGDRDHIVAIAVNDTFKNSQFQSFLNGVRTNLLLVSDEVHNMGAENIAQKLPQQARFRIGLSATPIRHNDPFGTKAIFDYFGEPVIEFDIKDAIDAGFLCKYNYYPIVCELDPEELDEYIRLSKKIARLMAMGDKDDFSTSVKLELIKRAKLTGSSADKKRKLKQLLSDSQDRQHTLIYSSEAINDGKRDIDRIVQIVGRDCQWRVAKFTAEESKDQRAEILGSFRAGDIDAIVAIKCLDEGVDIPQTKTAYILASSTNPRQFIQRRGRVLRQYDGKGHASIYDFIAIPPLDKLGEDEETFNIEKSMVERELDRINEFAEISENYGHTLSTLRDIRKKLKLLGA